MYITSENLINLRNYFDGYRHALIVAGILEFDSWISWVGCKFDIYDSGWGWDRILLHIYKNEKEVITILAKLFEEYLDDYFKYGYKELEEKHKNQFELYASKTPYNELKISDME